MSDRYPAGYCPRCGRALSEHEIGGICAVCKRDSREG